MKKTISVTMIIAMLLSVCGFYSYADNNDNMVIAKPQLNQVHYSDNGYGYTLDDYSGNSASKLQVQSKKSPMLKSSSSAYPSAYDSRDYGVNPPIRNQGSTGTCWAFASINALETSAIAKGYETPSSVKFSPSHLVWYTYALPSDPSDPLYNEGLYLDSPYDYGGNWLNATSTLSEWSGIASTDDFPFYPYDKAAMSNLPESGRYNRGSGYVLDKAVELKNSNEMKAWIMENGSCTVAIDYESEYENNSTYAYYNPNGGETNHNISVIGWDDSYSRSNFLTDPGVNGAWLIKDSWASWSHNKGYYWLSYADTTLSLMAGFTVRKADNYYNNYTYYGSGFGYYFSLSGTHSIANVFTAKDYEKIKSVSMFIDTDNVDVEFKIARNLPNSFTDPSNGTIASSFLAHFDRSGYYTVDLPSPVSVAPNQQYAVIAILSSDTGFNLPVEVPDSNTDYIRSTYTEGQSYCYFVDYSYGWCDAADFGIGNFWLNAQTVCDHRYVLHTVEPGCVNDGYKYYECSQCGDYVKDITLPASGEHQFGEWSPYTKQGNTMVSYRTCINCSAQVVRQYRLASENTITLDALIKQIFSRIREAIYNLFVVNRN